STNNSLGIAGVCWGCKIMPVRVTDAGGITNTVYISSGIKWAADNGARVIYVPYVVVTSTDVAAAAQYAQGKGSLVVAPTGDLGVQYPNPGNPAILQVGAVDSSDAIYSWSDTGNLRRVDLPAPGSVYSTIQ